MLKKDQATICSKYFFGDWRKMSVKITGGSVVGGRIREIYVLLEMVILVGLEVPRPNMREMLGRK